MGRTNIANKPSSTNARILGYTKINEAVGVHFSARGQRRAEPRVLVAPLTHVGDRRRMRR
ncbi:hypothetical protein CXB51_007435 [Gossypium anomalum]|uniref:Uncharacterized protein n=1 Tax=Gossypium anomalum TaxID=47600 RepID=A0A8J5Z1F0_9ROSI|nr:hypothetical protein CXB51_007435 [Gossypium anomalum]